MDNTAVMKKLLFLFFILFISSITCKNIRWRKCTEFRGSSNHLCAKVKVPLDYEKPTGDKIEVFISSVRVNNPKGIVWAFHGGPSEGDFETIMTHALPLFKDFHVYSVLQRGGKFGTPLVCPEGSNGIDEKCIKFVNEKWGNNLKHFSTSTAARDNNHLMEMEISNSSLPLYLYGVSYGSWHLNRFITMFGDTRKFSAAIFDSVFDSTVGQFQHSHFNYHHSVKSIFNHCDKDTFCGELFSTFFHGKNIQTVLDETLENIEEKQSVYKCIKQITDIDDPKPIHFKTLMIKGLDARTIFPAILFKLNRCSASDINQLKRIKSFFELMDKNFWPGEAYVANIYMSEMYRQPKSELIKKERLEKQEKKLISIPINSESGISIYEKWNRYPKDEFMYKYPSVKIPTLIILGDEDEATPLQWGLTYAKNTNAHLYRLPRTGHWGSLNRGCVKLVTEFFASNGQLIDKGCKNSIPVYDFKGKTTEMQRFYMAIFGSPNPWK
eukprot:gene758-9010_t